MRKIAFSGVLLMLFAACGDNSTTDPYQGIVVTVVPYRAVVDFGATYQFIADVQGTDNHAVAWYVNNVVGGDSLYGLIDAVGNYTAPQLEPPGTDSVGIEARSAADPSRVGRAWAVLVDPNIIYVNMVGSDSAGVGSLHRPYRTITKALSRVQSSQQILVSAGQFDIAAGERFPMVIPAGVTVRGAGPDSTFITGPGGIDPYTDALIRVHGDAITVEGLHIRSTNLLGVGIWLRPGRSSKLVRNRISMSYIGIYVNGPGGLETPRSIIDGNRLDSDSIGIVTADTCAPIIRNSSIIQCFKYGIDIRENSRPDLGVNDSTGAGRNTLDSCGINNSNLWLIYNGTVNTIMAVGNNWPFDVPSFNDQFIYDDEESNGNFGAVILE